MRKHIFKIFPICVIVIVLLLILFVLLPRDEAVPSYRFLDGRDPVAIREEKTGSVDKCYSYSFEANFNDICSNADTELIGAGFIDRTLPRDKSRERDYWLKSSFPRGPVKIKIYNNRKYIEHPISKKGELHPRDGWIVVEIAYWRWW